MANCALIANASGFTNTAPSSVVNATYTYWNSVTGPSGSGPGNGQSVSTGVTFEPWLASAPTSPELVTSSSVLDDTFNPTITTNLTVNFSAALSGNWTATFINSSGTTVRTITGSGASGAPVWDGRDGSGVIQPNGTYNYQVQITATTGEVGAPIRGQTFIDSTKQPQVTNITMTFPFFSPNADGSQDTTTLQATSNYDDPSWTINVKDGSGTTIRTATGMNSPINWIWDGKNNSGAVVADALYTLQLVVTDGTANGSGSQTATVDTVFPVSVINSPNGGVLSNVYQNGSTDFPVMATATDLNFNIWWLDYGAGASPASWTQISYGTNTYSNSLAGTWASGGLLNGTYTLRLRAVDKAGNQAIYLDTITLGHFTASQNVYEFNRSSSGTVTYSSIVPFTLSETLTITTLSGQSVRTLVNAQRAAGTFNDSWDGRNDVSQMVPDAPYKYIVSVSDGTHSMIWDQSSQVRTGGWAIDVNPVAHDPFNNAPMTLNYTLPESCVMVLGFSPTADVDNLCPAPQYCLIYWVYQESGAHAVSWAGTDNTGKYRSDLQTVAGHCYKDGWAFNTAMAFGTKPVITNYQVQPPVYGPDSGSQTVSLDLSTYTSIQSTVKIEYLNQSSLSVLRTITLNNVNPGHITTTWDGLADNAMRVAPGFYTVTVTATDTIGNVVKQQTLTTIQ